MNLTQRAEGSESSENGSGEAGPLGTWQAEDLIFKLELTATGIVGLSLHCQIDNSDPVEVPPVCSVCWVMSAVQLQSCRHQVTFEARALFGASRGFREWPAIARPVTDGLGPRLAPNSSHLQEIAEAAG